MRSSDLISGIFWLAIGLLTLWSTHYHVGNMVSPGPGLLPLILGILLILLSLVLLRQAKKSAPAKKTGARFVLPAGWRKIAYTIVILLAATFLFEIMGYLLTVFFLMVFLMVTAELRDWGKICLISALTALGVYFVFVYWLGQPLPVGFIRI